MLRMRAAVVATVLTLASAIGAADASEAPVPTANGPACAPDSYRNVSGHCVHRPMQADQPPTGASARCRDGSYSFSEHHRGTCSHHGGVATWF
jgi:hypothetical protein